MLLRFRLLVASALFLLVLRPGHATATETSYTTASEVVSAVEKVYGEVVTLSADFTQITRSTALGDETRQRGRVLMERPRKMRWEFTAPASKLFVTDGQTMWVWSPDDNQVIVYKDFSANASDVTGLLADLNKLHELFEVELIAEADAEERRSYVLDLSPKSAEQGNFKSLRLTFSRKKMLIETVRITDQFDNITELSFSQVKLDAKADASDFSFAVPDGAEVITPEGM